MIKKNILIIGSGGREHALGWKLKQSPQVAKIYFAPGNGGTQAVGENIDIKATEIDKLLHFALKNKIDLTFVGPEDPLAAGIVDLFEKNELLVFGPSKSATRLEFDKAWAVNFMKRNKIPHPSSYRFNNSHKAYSFFEFHKAGDFVIKANGLALGKGVILPQSKSEARDAIKRIMIDKEFGDAGNEIIIQERISGPEVSLMAFSDGSTVVPLLSVQDHKRIYDNDKGPNTGGMGAYAPVPLMTKKLINKIEKTILQSTIKGMQKEKCPYKGILYAGLMITKQGPMVLEYNARFGDPETQPLMMLLESDLYPILLSCIKGNLNNKQVVFRKGVSVCVVLASKGYPGKYEKGEIIHGLKTVDKKDAIIFHAGTIYKNGQLVTNGGRVLGVTTKGETLSQAINKAYSTIENKRVYFKGGLYRKDIGVKGLKNINKNNSEN